MFTIRYLQKLYSACDTQSENIGNFSTELRNEKKSSGSQGLGKGILGSKQHEQRHEKSGGMAGSEVHAVGC